MIKLSLLQEQAEKDGSWHDKKQCVKDAVKDAVKDVVADAQEKDAQDVDAPEENALPDDQVEKHNNAESSDEEDV